MKWSTRVKSTIIAIVVTLVLVSTTYAIFWLWSGTVSLTVDEAILVEYDSSDGAWNEPTKVWTVHAYPGETKEAKFNVTNVGGSDLKVTGSLSSAAYLENVSAAWYPYDVCLKAGKHTEFTLKLDVGAEASVGTMEFTLGLGRSECD